MLDPTALPGTLRARALMRQANWAPKSEVGLVECGLLNPSPPARLPVRPTGGLPLRPSPQSARPPVRPFARAQPRPCLLGPVRASSARPRVRASWAPSARPLHCLHPFRPCPPDRPWHFHPVRSSARPPNRVVSARQLVRPTVSSAPVSSSARPLRTRMVRHIHPPRPPHPLHPCETAAAIYTPPRLPSDHPAPRSPHWAPSLCCAFKDCDTVRGSGLRHCAMHLTSEAPNAYTNRRASHQSQQHLDLFRRSVAGLQNRRTSKGPMKLVIIADERCLCGLKVIVGSTWKAST